MNRYILTIPFVVLTALAGCDSVEPDGGDGGDQELITLVQLALTPQSGGTAAIYEAVFDEGGVLLGVDTLSVVAGVNYDAAIDLLNTTVDPPESLLPEIRDEESEAHRFFYEPEGDVAGRMTTIELDEDSNGDELGTTFVLVVAGGAATGDLRVMLRHYEEDASLPDDKRMDSPAKPEVPGVVENDVNVLFPMRISD